MPACEAHINDRRISCDKCYTNEELQGAIDHLSTFKLPSAPGAKGKPKRTDDKKPKRTSWMDELL